MVPGWEASRKRNRQTGWACLLLHVSLVGSIHLRAPRSSLPTAVLFTPMLAVLASTFLLYSVGLGAGAVPTAGALNWVLKVGLVESSLVLLLFASP